MKKKSTKRRRQSTSTTRTLTSPLLLPTLPFDLVQEILCRLPVKLLLQLRCVCKSWKSIISDPKFTNKHLSMSKASQDRNHLLVQTVGILSKLFLKDTLISSFLSAAVSTSPVSLTQLRFPTILRSVNSCYSTTDLRVCSCDGILCFTNVKGTIAGHSAILWNPSIRRFNMFPPLENPRQRDPRSLYSFGYDHYTHTYKIFAVSLFNDNTNEVNVCTLGTASWRSIQPIPDHGYINSPGVFLSGTINWLAYDPLSSFPYTIVSLDLEKESYQKLLQPNVKTDHWTLGVLRDCLCIVTSTDMFVDVWIMKEYGNKGPWTKFFSVPYMRDQGLGPYDNVYHACSCIAYKRANVEMFCDSAYTSKVYSLCYNNIIHPMPELDVKNRGSYAQIDPPKLKRLPGRPRVNRKRSVIEGPGGSQDARRSNTVRCGNCKEFGHNILRCQRDKTKKQKKLKVRRKEQSSDGNNGIATCSSQVTHNT